MSLAVIPSAAPFAWRFHGARGGLDFERFKNAAQVAERGKFDAIFLADSLSVREDRMGMEALKGFSNAIYFDALSVLPALASVTKNIGLVATASTTYNEPYHLARKFAAIDHLSHGRAGWNVITSGQDTEAYNFGLSEQFSAEFRYERASECLDVVLDLWDSWEDGAVIQSRETNIYFEPGKVHRLDHVGKHFKVRGPLNVPRPPQGHPVICQAGGSQAGWEFAARTADVLFGIGTVLTEAQRFYGEMKDRLARYGRQPDDLRIVLGMVPIVGKNEKEAREKFRAVQDCLTEKEGRTTLAHYIPGVDFSSFPMDRSIPDTPEINQAAMRFRIPIEKVGRRLTLREMLDSITAGVGTWTLFGSPGEIADTMVKWYEERGLDGFNISPHYLPGGLEDFVDMVVPELQERGVFRSEYEGATLRENMGLSRPINRFTSRSEGIRV